MSSRAQAPSDEEIARAIEKLRADPNLAIERKVRRLKWVSQDAEPSGPPGWLRWLVGLFAWLASAGRLLLWVVGALLALLLVAYLTRLLRGRGPRGAADTFVAPSHVRDLDIRPESLPADVGEAALGLWERGEHRAALALLYRAALSRLAHVHSVPIRPSSTEGECVALATRHVRHESSEYVARLVRVWQQAVYGGKDPDTPSVRALCAGFDAALNGEAAVAAAGRAA